MATIDFWFEYASTYSYLAAMRIGDAARAAGVGVVWRPFLLGPVFAAQGLDNSPFNIFPVKGRYMWRDMARQAEAMGIAFTQPEVFPQNGLLAARISMIAVAEGWVEPFAKAVYTAEFGETRNIGAQETIENVLAALGKDPAAVIAQAQESANKEALKAQTADAQARGIFGAPSFTTADGELFWGNDRLEEALAWALARAPVSQS